MKPADSSSHPARRREGRGERLGSDYTHKRSDFRLIISSHPKPLRDVQAAEEEEGVEGTEKHGWKGR